MRDKDEPKKNPDGIPNRENPEKVDPITDPQPSKNNPINPKTDEPK